MTSPTTLPSIKIPHPHVVADERGTPLIEGSRVLVSRLFSWHRQGTTIETLLRRYPQLGPARVLDALAFAYDNLDLVTADILREREETHREASLIVAPSPRARRSMIDRLHAIVVRSQLDGDDRSWAIFSNDRRYRYALGRAVRRGAVAQEPGAASRVAVFVMCNPSVAGAVDGDMTITKCVGFAERLCCDEILVVNAGALVSTDPTALALAADPIGPHNAEFLRWALELPEPIVRIAAWGAMASKIRARVASGIALAEKIAAERGGLWCLGKTRGGEPRHPSRLGYEEPLVSLEDGRRWSWS